jgi:UDP-N-acetylmuramate: L-alanyl-gamma-D-glutamyl-meso-diaminopimelate ligase
MRYHLIGICGTAMASLAGMLQARGFLVTGSDENVYPPMSTMLASLGIEVKQGYSPTHLEPPPDCVVVGNAIPRGNPEVEETLKRKLLYRSQAEVVKDSFADGDLSLSPARMARRRPPVSPRGCWIRAGSIRLSSSVVSPRISALVFA